MKATRHRRRLGARWFRRDETPADRVRDLAEDFLTRLGYMPSEADVRAAFHLALVFEAEDAQCHGDFAPLKPAPKKRARKKP